MKAAILWAALLAMTQPAFSQETVTIPQDVFLDLIYRAGDGCMTKAYTELLAVSGQEVGLKAQTVLGMAMREYPGVAAIDEENDTMERSTMMLMVLLPSHINRLFDQDSSDLTPVADLMACRDEVRAIAGDNLSTPN